MFKGQSGRLSSALIHVATIRDDRTVQIDRKVVSGLDIWFPKDGQQRVLWPSTIQLSLDYFVSFQKHAVPFDERALSACRPGTLGHSVRHLRLAHRLHRISHGKPQLITWAAIKGLTLRHSPPPVSARMVVVEKPKNQ